MSTVNALILRTAGTNCDYETAHAFERAGARTERIHINQIVQDKKILDRFQILCIPGGFTYGDDISSGKILANEILAYFKERIMHFVDKGKLILGICNGFQVLVKAGLLPGYDHDAGLATLANNDSNRFEDRWVYLSVDSSKSPFVKKGDVIYLPIAHGEGKFITKSGEVLDTIKKNDQVVFRYTRTDGGEITFPHNPNGSEDNIAGICDPTGKILGLMPHPERHMYPTQHPRWCRDGLNAEGDGLRVFRNAVNFIAQN